MSTLRVQGLSEVNRMLRRCSKETKKAVLREARAIGNIVRDEIRGRAPRDTGKLRRSVKTRVRRLSVQVTADARSDKSPRYPGYRYGRRLEFDPAFGGRYAFFYPGYEAKKAEAKARFEKELKRVVQMFGGK